MDHFDYREGELHCEDVSASRIAEEVGTPTFVYSAATLRHHYRQVAEAFAELDPIICFSVKSNGNLAVLKLLREEGCGFDVTSGGELFRAMKAGGDPQQIVYAGVGKSDEEIKDALQVGIAAFNIESMQEAHNIDRIAGELGKTAAGVLRVNPDVDPQTHAKTTTGKKESKFGVDLDRAEGLFGELAELKHLQVRGFHMHLGSPINIVEPYVLAVQRINEVVDRLRGRGHTIDWLDLGGGFGVDYEQGQALPIGKFAEAMLPHLRGRGYKIALEPGRYIAGNAGVLLTRVRYRKTGGTKKFVIVDASMTELIRPTLYEAFHFIWPTTSRPPSRSATAEGDETVDIVGPVCESGDYLARDRSLPTTERGDLLAIYTAGAYAFVMASNYNHRPRAAEVLVEGDDYRIVRRRETLDDLIRGEEL
jgi:diaminopimelate decarboxylase